MVTITCVMGSFFSKKKKNQMGFLRVSKLSLKTRTSTFMLWSRAKGWETGFIGVGVGPLAAKVEVTEQFYVY